MLKLRTFVSTASRRYHVKFYQYRLVSLAQWPWTVLAAVTMTGLLLWISPEPIQDLNVLASETGPSRALA